MVKKENGKNDLKKDSKMKEISHEKKVELLLKKYENSDVVVDIMLAYELGKKIGTH